MSNYPMNLAIAQKLFATLVLDQEWKGCKQFGIKPGVYCRVLIDGWYRDSITAESRDQAIEKFMNTNWR